MDPAQIAMASLVDANIQGTGVAIANAIPQDRDGENAPVAAVPEHQNNIIVPIKYIMLPLTDAVKELKELVKQNGIETGAADDATEVKLEDLINASVKCVKQLSEESKAKRAMAVKANQDYNQACEVSRARLIANNSLKHENTTLKNEKEKLTTDLRTRTTQRNKMVAKVIGLKATIDTANSILAKVVPTAGIIGSANNVVRLVGHNDNVVANKKRKISARDNVIEHLTDENSRLTEREEMLADEAREVTKKLKKHKVQTKKDVESYDGFINYILAHMYNTEHLTHGQGQLFLFILCRQWLLENDANPAAGVDGDFTWLFFPFFQDRFRPNETPDVRFQWLEAQHTIVTGITGLLANGQYDWIAIRQAIMQRFPNLA